MYNNYRINIRYWENGRWLKFTDYQSAFTVQDAIDKCITDNLYEFDHQNARIDVIYRETDTAWVEVDWE